MEIDLNSRYQTLIILWFALLMSVVMFFVISFLAALISRRGRLVRPAE